MVLHWALQGPFKEPYDFQDPARLLLPFLKNTFSKPSEHRGTHLWSLLYFTKVQGTLMDLHGPQMDPKIDPARLILEDPCQLKALQGPSKVQIDQFCIGLKTTDILKNTAWFEANQKSGCRAIII